MQHIIRNQSFLTEFELILITAKGFPDEASVELLNCIMDSANKSVFYVGDLDPFGLAIYFNFRKRLKIANRTRFHWLGLRGCDLVAVSSSVVPISRLGIQVFLASY